MSDQSVIVRNSKLSSRTEAPAYYVFSIGLTIVGIIVATVWYANYWYQKPILETAKEHHRISIHVLNMHRTAAGLGIRRLGR